jgi:hypothetical protein
MVLGPRDFVDSWLSRQQKFKGPFEFIDPTRHCTRERDVWRVGVHDPENERKQKYFLVRWRPPYHFSLLGSSDHPRADCTEADPDADAFRTLFPDRDHH